jgi:hypothetical protein
MQACHEFRSRALRVGVWTRRTKDRHLWLSTSPNCWLRCRLRLAPVGDSGRLRRHAADLVATPEWVREFISAGARVVVDVAYSIPFCVRALVAHAFRQCRGHLAEHPAQILAAVARSVRAEFERRIDAGATSAAESLAATARNATNEVPESLAALAGTLATDDVGSLDVLTASTTYAAFRYWELSPSP